MADEAGRKNWKHAQRESGVTLSLCVVVAVENKGYEACMEKLQPIMALLNSKVV